MEIVFYSFSFLFFGEKFRLGVYLFKLVVGEVCIFLGQVGSDFREENEQVDVLYGRRCNSFGEAEGQSGVLCALGLFRGVGIRVLVVCFWFIEVRQSESEGIKKEKCLGRRGGKKENIYGRGEQRSVWLFVRSGLKFVVQFRIFFRKGLDFDFLGIRVAVVDVYLQVGIGRFFFDRLVERRGFRVLVFQVLLFIVRFIIFRGVSFGFLDSCAVFYF